VTAREIDRFHRTEALFNAALELPAGEERDAWLREQCASDADLMAEVRQLLENHAQVSAAAPRPAESLPKFGNWQAIRLLGRGGMGVVYLAERTDGAFRMKAAVKVVPLALASLDIEERFRRERQFLASLEHPKIARLIDGGVTDTGLPYLVMEFVDGLNIERFCETRQLDPRARIGLVRQVLEALVYVHGCQVIHRDLKPSNILVDAQGNAKLLDFGTARLVDAGGDAAITKTGVFAFTPECASPEQVQGRAVTFASDIYSVGVLLYRLLTGRPPYRFTDHSPAAIAERIHRAAPDRSGLDAPLDAILMTALDKDPAKRYASAVEMDADLARYLEGKPVRARGPLKFFKVAIAAGLMAIAALAAWAVFHRSPEASIAVLPFASGDASTQYLSKGLTDELTEALTKEKALRVILPGSVAQRAGKNIGAREIGRLLHAAYVLEGTVNRQAGRVKIVARLERASDGSLLWSSQYDRPEAELTVVQSELAASVASSLRIAPIPVARHVPPPDAHDYVMKARYEMQQMTSEGLRQSEANLQRAIDLDPKYAIAYYDLGTEKYNEFVARGSTYQTDEERKTSAELLQHALELDPNIPAAYGHLAIMAMQYDWDWDRAERDLKMGASLGSSPSIELGYAELLLFTGRAAEAEQHIRKMQEIDPFNVVTLIDVAQMRLSVGRAAESRELAEKVASANPKSFAARLILVGCDVLEGHTEAALEKTGEWKKAFPPAQMLEAGAYAHQGNRQEALRRMRPFEDKYPNPGVAMQWFALIYAMLDDEPNTVKWLNRSADHHEWQVLNIAVNPIYAKMRGSAGFQALEKRIGLLR
jgi:TolB-like protein/predicted Zn-dependent protease